MSERARAWSDEVGPRNDAGVRDLVMPRVSRSVSDAAITKWSIRQGQHVSEGDVLAEISAANVTMEIEAPCDGVVEAVLKEAGSGLIAAGTVIARIASDGPERDVEPKAASAPATAALPAVDLVVASDTTFAGASRSLSLADALREGLRLAMMRDESVFVIGEGLSDPARCSPVLRGILDEFGHGRVVATPITPHAMVGLAAGAALAGLKPVVDVTAWALMLQAMDPIIQSAAKMRYRSNGRASVPLVLRGRNGAWARTGPMHSVNFAAWFASVPGLKVVCPATASCAKGLLAAAISDPDPVIILECDSLYDAAGDVPDSEGWTVPIGKARVACEGVDLSIVTYGASVQVGVDAAAILSRETGFTAEVIDLRSLRPLDMPAVLASVRKTGRLLTLDEATPVCSISSEVCAAVAAQAFQSLKAAPARMEAADVPVPYAANLERLVYADAADVAAKARRLIEHSRV